MEIRCRGFLPDYLGKSLGSRALLYWLAGAGLGFKGIEGVDMCHGPL